MSFLSAAWEHSTENPVTTVLSTVTGVLGGGLLLAHFSGLTSMEHTAKPTDLDVSSPVLGGQYFKSDASGLLVYQREWLAPDPVGAVILLHGGGEHCGRYHHVAAQFVAAGLSVYALDHQGHGQSDGDRMHVESFEVYVQDAQQRAEAVAASLPAGTPLYLFGHSVGGLLAVMLAAKAPSLFSAVSATGPCMQLADGSDDPLTRAVLPWAVKVLPKARVGGPTAEFLSHDAAIVAQYGRDPLNASSATLAWVSALFTAQHKALTQCAPAISLPFLVLQGADDQVCAPAGSEAMVEALGSEEKQFIVVPGGLHEILNDAGFQDHIGAIVAWFKQHSPA